MTGAQILPALAGNIQLRGKFEESAILQNLFIEQHIQRGRIVAVVIRRILFHAQHDLFGVANRLHLIALALYSSERRHCQRGEDRDKGEQKAQIPQDQPRQGHSSSEGSGRFVDP